MAARKRTAQPATERPSRVDAQLKACPACGEKKGELASSGVSRFPFAVQCRACGWSTAWVKLEAIAEKLWNEAKRKGTPRTPRP
jgi:hypothetical protein